MQSYVHLEHQLNTPTINTSSEKKLVYLLADIITDSQVNGSSAALNIALVLDKSGSMYADDKLYQVISAVQHCIDFLRPEDHISVIAFADRARVLIPSSTIYDKESARQVIQGIDHVEVGSGTEMLYGIQAATSELYKHLDSDKTNHMIILTDGLTMEAGACKEACLSAAHKGITISTIGVGDDFNEEFLLQIANNCRGTSYYIEDSRDIPAIFQKELAAAQSVVVSHPSLKILFSREVELRKAYIIKPMLRDLGLPAMVERTMTLELGDLHRQEPQTLMLELVVPSRPAGTYRLAQLDLSYRLPLAGQEQRMNTTQDICIEYRDHFTPPRADNRFLQVLDAVSVFRQQTRALQLAESGQNAQATQLLRTAATRLLSQGHHDLAQEAMQEAGRIEQGQKATNVGTKRLTYGTRKLTQRLDQLPDLSNT